MQDNIVKLSDTPEVFYEVKPDGNRRYHFSHNEILKYLRNNKISFKKFSDKNKFDWNSYDNIRRALARYGGIRGLSHNLKPAQINITFGINENKLYSEFISSCKAMKIRPHAMLKNYIRDTVKKQVEDKQ